MEGYFMKKRILIVFMLVLACALFASDIIKPVTTKFQVKDDGHVAMIYMTEIYSSEYWTEVYMKYEEDVDAYDEAAANKIIYEFITKYKLKRKFSTVDIEELRGPAFGAKKVTVLKRLILRQVRK